MAIELSPELSAKISNWRQKASLGTLSIPEMKEAVLALRQARFNAASKGKETKKSTKAPSRSADDLLKDL